MNPINPQSVGDHTAAHRSDLAAAQAAARRRSIQRRAATAAVGAGYAPLLPLLALAVASGAAVLSIVAIAEDDVASIAPLPPAVVAPSARPLAGARSGGRIAIINRDECHRPIVRGRPTCE
jgi:hypothetical protein